MTANIPKHIVYTVKSHDGPILCARFNKKGQYLLTCGQDKTIRLWNPHKPSIDPTTGEPLLIKTYRGFHSQKVLDVAVFDDNSKFVSCGGDKIVFLWDVASGQVIRKFQEHSQDVNAVALNKEGTVAASAGYDRTVCLWDLRSRDYRPIQKLEHARDSVTSVAIDGHEIYSASVDGCLRCYDLRAGRMRHDDVKEAVTHVSFSKGHSSALLSCLDGCVRLLDKDSGSLLNFYRGHKNNSYKVESCFGNADAHIISGSEDGLVYFWDIVEAKTVHSMKCHARTVSSVCYHPELPCLVTASYDGSAHIWGLYAQ